MATALPAVKLPKNVWVDIYAETGITIGKQIIIQNTGGNRALLCESLAVPTPAIGYNVIPPDDYVTNATTGTVGAWAYSSGSTRLQVEEVV